MRFVKWIAILAMTLSFPLGALAVDLGGQELEAAGANAGIESTSDLRTLSGIIGNVINAVLGIIGVLIFVYFIYAGFLWMTAQGEEKQVKKAKDIMKNTVVGLIVVTMAYSIVMFIFVEVFPLPGGYGGVAEVAVKTNLNINEANPFKIIGSLLSTALNLLGVLLLVITIYAGFLWMTAAGDSKQTGKAKDMMKNALIGLIIILSARIVTGFVIEQLARNVNLV